MCININVLKPLSVNVSSMFRQAQQDRKIVAFTVNVSTSSTGQEQAQQDESVRMVTNRQTT